MSRPPVSVVMSVYNDAEYLRQSMDSILSQEGVDFEFIVVDDGSTDESPGLLDEYAGHDRRVRVIHKENEGLTKALIRGCEEARGEYIARQDADDVSLPGRLARLVQMLDEDDGLAFVSSWAEVMGPEGEALLTHKRPVDPQVATHQLLYERNSPPGHGSVMFRKDRYEEVGGYRPQFYYAQDGDLWLRLGLAGQLGYAQEVLYRYRLSPVSISGARHLAKLPYVDLVDACHAARLAGQDEAPVLARAPENPHGSRLASPASEARSCYFIARCLVVRRDRRALRYLLQCIRSQPWHIRAWIRLVLALPLLVRSSRANEQTDASPPS